MKISNAILTICMWRGSTIDLLNDWYKYRLGLQGTFLTCLAWWLFFSQRLISSPCLSQKWGVKSMSQQVSGMSVSIISNLCFHSVLARSDNQVWNMETDKPRSTQRLAMKWSVWQIFHIVMNRLLFSHPPFCIRARQISLCSRKSCICL